MAREIKIAMLGYRGTGKTSLLTGMWQELELHNRTSALRVDIDPASTSTLQTHLAGMRNQGNTFGATPAPPTRDPRRYGFTLSPPGKDPVLRLTFVDSPGGNLDKEKTPPKDYQDVITLVRESDVVLLAIDTPSLVEYLQNQSDNNNKLVGQYCDAFNRHMQINSILIENYRHDLSSPRLLILAPVKCEHHLAAGLGGRHKLLRPSDIAENAFSPLITYLKGDPFSRQVAVVITPAQTIGGFHYVSMRQPGSIGPDGQRVIEPEVRYGRAHGKAAYSPKDCDQPLMYILRFAIARELEHRGHPSFISKLFSPFRRGSVSIDDLLRNAQQSAARLSKIDQDFRIVQGAELLSPRVSSRR